MSSSEEGLQLQYPFTKESIANPLRRRKQSAAGRWEGANEANAEGERKTKKEKKRIFLLTAEVAYI